MKSIAVLFVLSLSVSQAAKTGRSYHRNVGIDLAGRIKAAEEAGEAEQLKSRMYGGWYPEVGTFPFVAGIVVHLLDTEDLSVCGGVLVSNFRVLTAAHCWYDGEFAAEEFEVVLGSTTLTKGGTRILSHFVILNDNFTPDYYSHDIGFVIIPRVEYSAAISNITLPYGRYLTEHMVNYGVVAIGYGTKDDYDYELYNALQAVNYRVISNAECSKAYDEVYDRSAICTHHYPEQIVGACLGDSGAPLVLPMGGERILVGIHVFGDLDGCKNGRPDGYMRVAHYIKWIENNM